MIYLTYPEKRYCEEFGYLKTEESKKRGLKDKPAFQGEEWKGTWAHIKGCYGEAIFSKYLVGTVLPLVVNQDLTGESDVLGYEVKSTLYRDGTVYVPWWTARDKYNVVVVVVHWGVVDGVVSGEPMGWFYQGMAATYPREKGKHAHMVPMSALNNMDTLPWTNECISYLEGQPKIGGEDEG